MDFRSVLLSLLVIVIWGINFPIIKFGLEELPPLLFSSLRFLIVAIPAIFFIPFPRTSIWNVFGVGIFLGVLKFGFLFIAMRSDASAGISSLLLQVQVIFTILLSVIIFKEKLKKSQILGIFVALIGFSFFLIEINTNVTFLGVFLLISAAFFWSISNNIMKGVKGVNLLHFMVWVCLIPPLPLFILSYIFESKEPISILLLTTKTTWLSLIYVSYFSTLIAFAIWGWLLKSHKVADVTPFALLIPIVGMASSNILLNEKFSSMEILGAVLILSGLSILVLGNRIYNSFKLIGKKR